MRFNALFIGLAAVSSLAMVHGARVCPDDPYADPANDQCNPLKYIPSLPLNAVVCVLYALIGFVFVYWHWRGRARWMMVLTIGAFAEAIGFALRLRFRNTPHRIFIYAICNMFVVLSPCCFLAADYVILKHLVAYLDAEDHIRPFKVRWLTRAFVWSDVFTFLIQAGGGGMAVSFPSIGQKLFLVGLILQLVSFGFFSVLWAVFGFRLKKNDPALWQLKGWKTIYFALGVTCICFLIRSFYRVIELAQGFEGYLQTHEGYFLLLDTLPLFVGICCYAIFWPGRYIPNGEQIVRDRVQSSASGGGLIPQGYSYEMDAAKGSHTRV